MVYHGNLYDKWNAFHLRGQMHVRAARLRGQVHVRAARFSQLNIPTCTHCQHIPPILIREIAHSVLTPYFQSH